MADSNTEIDLDSVIDRLLEGELARCSLVIVIGCDVIDIERVKGGLGGLGAIGLVSLVDGRSLAP